MCLRGSGPNKVIGALSLRPSVSSLAPLENVVNLSLNTGLVADAWTLTDKLSPDVEAFRADFFALKKTRAASRKRSRGALSRSAGGIDAYPPFAGQVLPL